MSTTSATRIVDRPQLEETCPQCLGELSFRDPNGGGSVRCLKCGGWGVVPTELGEHILELIKHNKSRLGIRQ